MIKLKLNPVATAICGLALCSQVNAGWDHYDQQYMNRVSVFPICKNMEISCNTDEETVAEIVVSSKNGKKLIYTDSEQQQLGFVDIKDPHNPKPLGTVKLSGEPTSVDIKGKYALVAIDTSSGDVISGSENASGDIKFTRDMTGDLVVVNIKTQAIVKTIPLSGQPDSVSVSPNGKYVAIAIENERNEDLCVGGSENGKEVKEDDCEAGGGELGTLGQGPAGTLDIVDLKGANKWNKRTVAMTGLSAIAPKDPEPEYVDVRRNHIAVVTMQENNHIVLVDLKKGKIVNDFPAGTVDLDQIDTKEEDPALISLTDSKTDVPREPDGISWVSKHIFATADEGDFKGGSRGFTIMDDEGNVLFTSGNSNEHLAVRLGHYPDDRSKNKGNEPENVDAIHLDDAELLAVASERSSLIYIYDVADPENPELLQTLPAGVGPEGVKAIPKRNLLVAASEVDDRGDKIRSVINIYEYGYDKPDYPKIQSANRVDGTPIPWGALSGLAAEDSNTVYSIYDSFYQQSRIFRIDVSDTPAVIDQEIVINDNNHVLANLNVVQLADESVEPKDASRKNVFDSADLKTLINDDNTVNLDPEGIAIAEDGGFWIASEGNGTVGDKKRPINSHNMVLGTDEDGTINRVITLPEELNAKQLRFGFEGVAEYDGKLYVAMQRAWDGDNMPRIGVYDLDDNSWSFLFYPLDAAESQNGGWVGLSEITSLGDGKFAVIERDNQAGVDAAIKRVYQFDTTGLSNGATVAKQLVDDMMDDLQSTGGLVLEKVEGMAVMPNGEVLVVNDNDGVDDSNGETQLLNLGQLFDAQDDDDDWDDDWNDDWWWFDDDDYGFFDFLFVWYLSWWW